MPGVAISLLGPPTVSVSGRNVTLVSVRQAAVLALLALNAPSVVSFERVIDAVWGDDPPVSVRAALQVHVSQLRKQIRRVGGVETLIVTGQGGYRLDVGRDDVDALRFEDALAQSRRLLSDDDPAGAAALASEALSWWRGPALGLDGVEFAIAAATRLGDQRLAMVEVLADAMLRLGLAVEVVGLVEPFAVEARAIGSRCGSG